MEHSIGTKSDPEQIEIWVSVKDFKLSCQKPETILFTIYAYMGNLNKIPQQQPRNAVLSFLG